MRISCRVFKTNESKQTFSICIDVRISTATMSNAFKLILSHIVNGRNLRAHNLPLHVFIRSSAGNSASSPGKIIPFVDPAMQTRVLPVSRKFFDKNRFSFFGMDLAFQSTTRAMNLCAFLIPMQGLYTKRFVVDLEFLKTEQC